MFKKMMLIGLLVLVFATILFAGGMTESERLKIIEETKQYVGIPDLEKDSWLSHSIEKRIQQNENLTNSMIQSLYHIVIRDKEIDIRELNMVLKFLKYGDDDAKKTALEILPRSIEKNISVIKDMDYDYFYNVLKPNVNSQYPALIVESCISLYKISSLYELTFDDSLLSKLEYYARGIDSENWKLDYNLDSKSLERICEERKYDKEKYAKERAINGIRRKVIRSLFLINTNKTNKTLIEIMNNENELKYQEDVFEIKKMIKKLFEYRENGLEDYNFKSNRDPNWNGALSAAYCNDWWWRNNTLQYPYVYPEDCANFGSQCLIAAGLDLSDYTGSQYLDGWGCIPSAPNLHTYLSSRPDVSSEVLNIWSHQSWNPNEHIPNWFTTGDIALLGIYNISPAIHTIINHEGSGSAARFGAHTGGVIDSLLSSWIKQPYTGTRYHFDYVTFFHISDSLYAGTQVPGGNINGTWTEENSPYYINGDITIQSGNLLTIEEGTYIEFTGNYNLNVYGQLISNGTEGENVTFTAQNIINGWNGINFYQNNTSGINSELNFTIFEYGRATGGYPVFFGGAVHCDYSSPVFEDCLFQHNTADGGGGAMCIYNWSSPTIRRTRFVNNSAGNGGAIFIWNAQYYYCIPVFEESIFENNTASNIGGAIYLNKNAEPTLINCTFNQNTALARNGGGALYCYDNCVVKFFNTIMWQDTSPELYIDDNCSVEVHDCDLTEGEDSYILGQYSWITFEGNILESDPKFVDATNGNYNLEWTSPCIDKGSEGAVRIENRSYQRNRDDDGTLPDIGSRYYYQPDYINQPTDLTVSTENDSIYLDWIHGDGAIFYKIFESLDPYNSFTVIDSVFGKTEYSKPISNNKNFYKITGANNRSTR